jgi:hypothetical protein
MAPITARRFPFAALFMTIASTVATLVAPPHAAACDLCAIYTGSLMQQEKTGLQLGVAEQYTDFGSVREDGHAAKNPDDEWLQSSITQIVVGYAITPKIAVQANIPLISREYRRIEDGAVRGDESGLGDVSLIARYSPLSRLFAEALVHVEVFAGIKTPTGDSDRLSEELEEDHHEGEHEEDQGGHSSEEHAVRGQPGSAGVTVRPRHADHEHEHESAVHGHDLALGSGSVDGVFGVTLHGSWKRLFANASLQYVVRGNGDFGYEYDDDLTWELSPGVYVVTHHDWTASLRGVLSGEDKGKDRQKGEVMDDTAITAVYLGPGAGLTWRDSLHVTFAADLPMHQDVSGRQIVADYRLRGGLVWHF